MRSHSSTLHSSTLQLLPVLDGNEEAYMRELYERFRREIMSGEQPDFYDRDELLDIYDYAQDEGDVMVQMWVFLTAARQYPDADRFLGERMAFFMSYIDSRAGTDMLDRKTREDSPLWDVLSLSIADPATVDIESEVKRIIDRHTHLDSETIIKLVDYLRNQKCTAILGRNIDILKKKADDLNGLEFEVAAAMLDTEEDLDRAAEIADKLTESEPFNIDNWLLLAKIEIARNNLTAALAAIDYARAIDPDFRPAKVLSATILVARAETRPSALEQLTALFDEDPSDTLALNALVHGLKEEGRTDQACRAYLQYWQLQPTDNAVVFHDIMQLHPTGDMLTKVMDLLMQVQGRNEDAWVSLATRLIDEGMPQAAIDILEYYHNAEGLHRGMELLLALYYRFDRWSDFCTLFSLCCHANDLFVTMQSALADKDKDDNPDLRPSDTQAVEASDLPFRFSLTTLLMYAASQLMLRQYDTAKSVAETILQNHPDPSDFDDRIRLEGILQIAAKIRDYATTPSSIPSAPDFRVL